MSGWFPPWGSNTDETGADIICSQKKRTRYPNKGGNYSIGTISDLKKNRMRWKNNGSMIFEKPIPFSKELVENVDN
ncbi:MAG: hypothetical protein CM15mP106_7190 [Candidatus Neomarinimicrobiota bacterium]|nr:MAG: hypothetical protein CM15mP106_7190 [Candidatus Neomarinimicrobiota bacterium]